MVSSKFFWLSETMAKLYVQMKEVANYVLCRIYEGMTNLVSWPREGRGGGKQTGGAKIISVSGKRKVVKRVGVFGSAMARKPAMKRQMEENVTWIVVIGDSNMWCCKSTGAGKSPYLRFDRGFAANPNFKRRRLSVCGCMTTLFRTTLRFMGLFRFPSPICTWILWDAAH
jgi:hypothetical protein